MVRITDLQKPEQILDLIENENVRDLISLIGMSQGMIATDGRPEWAIRAGGEFWRCCFNFSKAKRAKSENYRVGYLMGFAKGLSPQIFANERGLKALLTSGGLSELIHSSMESAPASEAADFYAGLVGDFRSTQKWKRLRRTKHDHHPVHDALGNAEALIRIFEGER